MRNVIALWAFMLVSCGLVEFSRGEVTDRANRPPNIVLIMADDLGYGELGSYGQTKIKTPVLDQLARDGMRFTNFYCGNAVCAPSRCVLMTGKHSGHAYVRNNGDPGKMLPITKSLGAEFPGQNPLPAEEVTIAEMLKQKDYATAAIGKWGLGHFGSSGDPNLQGFDLFYGFNCQRHAHNHYPKFLWRNRTKETLPGNDRTLSGDTFSQDRFREVALEFIDENKDRPFFLYLPFAIPHLAIQVPEDELAQYADSIEEEEYMHRGYIKHPQPRAGYAAMITHMDRDIGAILDRIDQYGLTNDTLVLFTSDNGPTYDRLGGSDSEYFNSALHLRGFKGSLYEGGIRVPMIVRWPGKVAAGTTSDYVGAFYDFMPTFAEATGTISPRNIDGLSILPELLGKSQPAHDYLYWEFPAYGGQQALRAGKWKAVRQNLQRSRVENAGELELYNLELDPSESKNVAVENAEIASRLSKWMQQARVPSAKFPFPALDREE